MVRLKGVIKLNNKEKGRKVYLNDWLEELYSNIDKNIKMNTAIYEETKNEIVKRHIDRDNKLKNKLDTYKKTEEDNVYYYFFSSELVDIMWILLENICNEGNVE